MHGRLEAIIEVANTVKSHWDEILNYFDSRVTNGVVECINSIVQLIKEMREGIVTNQVSTISIFFL
ncbi:hypothetical protein FXW07_15730 [Methanosarcina sp. DH1]|nr:hypothetical protein [Methanosarcina sp. DH1]